MPRNFSASLPYFSFCLASPSSDSYLLYPPCILCQSCTAAIPIRHTARFSFAPIDSLHCRKRCAVYQKMPGTKACGTYPSILTLPPPASCYLLYHFIRFLTSTMITPSAATASTPIATPATIGRPFFTSSSSMLILLCGTSSSSRSVRS